MLMPTWDRDYSNDYIMVVVLTTREGQKSKNCVIEWRRNEVGRGQQKTRTKCMTRHVVNTTDVERAGDFV